jgi:TRAP-type C4-dicarboxylate transport system permease small subunit
VSSVGAPDETGPSSIVSRVETVLLSVLLLGCIGIAAAQIVLRNVFSYSLYWADEWIRLAVLWLAMIGAMAARPWTSCAQDDDDRR